MFKNQKRLKKAKNTRYDGLAELGTATLEELNLNNEFTSGAAFIDTIEVEPTLQDYAPVNVNFNVNQKLKNSPLNNKVINNVAPLPNLTSSIDEYAELNANVVDDEPMLGQIAPPNQFQQASSVAVGSLMPGQIAPPNQFQQAPQEHFETKRIAPSNQFQQKPQVDKRAVSNHGGFDPFNNNQNLNLREKATKFGVEEETLVNYEKMSSDIRDRSHTLKLEEEVIRLKQELEALATKERKVNEGMEKTKEIYAVARHNGEKIILKAIDFAFMIKTDISNLLERIKKFKDDHKVVINFIEEFIVKNDKIFQYDREEADLVAKVVTREIIKKIK